jgi:hypothetical protein
VKLRRPRGFVALAFNGGLVVGAALFFAALYPLGSGLPGGWRVAGYGVGGLLFWVIGVNLMAGGGQAAVAGLLATSVAGAWVARWQAEAAWLPAAIVLGGALLAAGLGLWLSLRAPAAEPAP